MSPVLPGAHDPIDFARSRVIAPDRLGGFCGKPHLAQLEVQPMRPAQRPQVDRVQPSLPYKINHRQRMKRAKSVVRNISRSAIRRSDHFVRIVSHRNGRQNTQRPRIDNGERVILFGKRKKSRARSGLRTQPSGKQTAETKPQQAGIKKSCLHGSSMPELLKSRTDGRGFQTNISLSSAIPWSS